MDFQKAKTEITRFGMMPSIVGLQEALKAIDPEIYIYIITTKQLYSVCCVYIGLKSTSTGV